MNLATSTLLRILVLVATTAAAAHAETTVKQSGSKLKLKGDEKADSVAIESNGALGEVLVIVNGAPGLPFVGVRDIAVKCGDGADTLRVSALQISDSLSVNMGNGDDSFELNTNGSAFSLPVFVGGNVDVNMGGEEGDEIVVFPDIGRSVVLARNLTVKGVAHFTVDGIGTSSDSEVEDCYVGGNLRIEFNGLENVGSGGTPLVFDDLNVGGETKIDLSDAKNEIRMTDSHFARKFQTSMRGGDDVIDFLQDRSEFNTNVVIDGGAGVDAIKGAAQSDFAVIPTLKDMEIVP